ncbi:MAG TPA: hypothetical protein VJO12_03120 [Stellaceae bacterium]|nr:hypothetical protein [Stellaceae bacterium]
MVHRNSLTRSVAALFGIGFMLDGCVAYGPSAGYPASPYGYYGYGDYGGYAPGYAYPPGYAYGPGFFGSSLDFSDRRFRHEHEERRREHDRAHTEHHGHGPTAHPPGPVHVAPAGRPPALSRQTASPHSAALAHSTAQGHASSSDGRPGRN